MNGKVSVVTGATSGIGEVTARELARKGARVVIVCRNRTKGEEVRAGIRQATGRDVELVVADLAVQAEVRRAAREILERWDRLDLLVNNAGAIHPQRTTTPDGIETTFAVNHLAPFLLTNLLLDRLKHSAPARIVNVASRAHVRYRVNFEDIEFHEGYLGLKAYAQSKLCNVLFTYELARRLEGTRVTANCLHPGVIASGFGHDHAGLFSVLVHIASPFMWTPEKGARSSIRLATAPELASVSGKYFDENGNETRSSRRSYDHESQRRLWELSERMTGMV